VLHYFFSVSHSLENGTGKGERHIKDSPPFRPRQPLSSSGEGTPPFLHAGGTSSRCLLAVEQSPQPSRKTTAAFIVSAVDIITAATPAGRARLAFYCFAPDAM